ncbi:MAG: hypothetical protein HYY58_00960 [Candidatus Omnitrophica bacterium]|nr:hypothetical protein [Candidatus Omnitrophota bacterium]
MPPGRFQFRKFGQREKVWSLLFVAVTMLAAGHRTILRPRIDQVRKAKAASLRLDNELVKMEAERPDVDARRASVEAARELMRSRYQELEQLEEGLLNRQDLDRLLEQVVAKRAKLQVQINAVTPLKDEPRQAQAKGQEKAGPSFYKRLFVQLDTYATFDDLIAYTKSLEAQGPYQRVRGVMVKIEGQDVLRPRALILTETLLAETPEQVEKRRTEVFTMLERLAARQLKDPFLASEKPKEEQQAVGLELTGVFGEAASLTALINGEAYKVGDMVQGKRIVAIQRDQVVLEQGSRRFLLYPQGGGE